MVRLNTASLLYASAFFSTALLAFWLIPKTAGLTYVTPQRMGYLRVDLIVGTVSSIIGIMIIYRGFRLGKAGR